jgi:hypothetical protein
VVVAGSGQIKDIAITPGVTVKRVLEEAGLQDNYILSRKGSDAMANDADIYNLVSDKEKLYATPEDVSVGDSTASPSGDQNYSQAKLIRTRKLYPEAIAQPVRLTAIRQFKSIKLIKTGKDIPYWQESSWIKTGGTFRGFYKTDYGSWRGLIERNYKGDYSFYIFEPPQVLKNSDHGQCFTYKGNSKYEIHFSEKPKDVDSGIITIESVIAETFRNQKGSYERKDEQNEGGTRWKPNFLEILFPRLKWRR